MPPTEEYDFAAGVSTQGPEREKTTDEMLVDECNAYLAREDRRRWLTLSWGSLIFGIALAAAIGTAHASPGWWHPEENGTRSHFRGAPLPYSCDTVRTAVKSFSKEELLKLAKQFGVKVTASQRREAQKCLAQ